MISQNKRLLVIDDDPDVLVPLSKLMEIKGFYVETALGPFEALSMLKKRECLFI